MIAEACAEVGVRVSCAYGVTDRHGAEGTQRGLAENERFLREGGRGMVGVHAAFTCNDDTLDAAAELAAHLGVGVHIHVAEGPDDAGAADRLRHLTTPDWLLVHGVHLADDHGLQGTIVHNPRSNMNNAVGYAAPTRFTNPVGLGTDGIGADMLEEFRLAYVRLREYDVTATPDTVVGDAADQLRALPRSASPTASPGRTTRSTPGAWRSPPASARSRSSSTARPSGRTADPLGSMPTRSVPRRPRPHIACSPSSTHRKKAPRDGAASGGITMTRLALYLQDAHPIREAIELAQYAEAKGFDAVWQADSRLVREAVVPMAAFARDHDDDQDRLGRHRHLDPQPGPPGERRSRRSTTSPPAGSSAASAPGGIRWRPRSASTARRPLHGDARGRHRACGRCSHNETVTFDGDYVHLDGVELDYVHQERRPKDVPIYIGATGMQMMELTGEIADGVVLNYLVSPDVQRRGDGAPRPSAPPRPAASVDDIDRPQLVVCSVDEDRQAALDGARLMVTQYLGQQPHIMKASGVPQSLLDEIGEVLTWPATHEQVVAASKLVPDEIVQMITASGTPDEVRAKVAEYVANGCTCPILYPLGPDVRLMIDTFAGWQP